MKTEIEIKKNEVYIIDIDSIGSSGEGIGKVNGFTIFVEDAVVGDKLEIKILKLKNSYGYGKLLQIKEPSPHRIEAKCKNTNKCGGCQLQNYTYSTQLELKQKKVRDNLERIGNFKNINISPIIGMDNPWNYRNKAQFPVGIKDGKVKIGFYSPRTHNIVDLDTCHIQHSINDKILEILKGFIEQYSIAPYNEETHKGLIRHIFTRVGFNTKEIMVCLVINGKKLPFSNELIEKLKTIDGMTSIVLNYNTNKNNIILGDKTEIIWGNLFITDYIGNIKFEISPTSFFQVNPVQTKILYEKALEFAELTGQEIVWDAYCGIGTISLFLASKAKKVYGVEISKAAIEDAKKNAEINNIHNVEFYVGKAEEVIPNMYTQHNIKADVIIVDPPRKGCGEELLKSILEMKPNKIIYISCDSATLARDLKILCNDEYKISKIQPVDMFPSTIHVETICIISRKTNLLANFTSSI